MEQDVQNDIQNLAAYSVKFAGSCLCEYGEFYPFGDKIISTGEIKPVEFFAGDEHPESEIVLESLNTILEKELAAGKIRAFCIACDVRVTNEEFPSPIDAILVTFTHRDMNGILKYYYPYQPGPDLKPEFLEPWAETA